MAIEVHKRKQKLKLKLFIQWDLEKDINAINNNYQTNITFKSSL